ncbi:aromatic amino acid hydroxylase [Flavobacteriaceae bacterium]|nr:aromatic amino acid hydroxylase [Flavobacteriaceae bacterium]
MEPIAIHTTEIVERLPRHLKQFIAPQNYEQYTPINQAVWRYVMRKNVVHLKNIAHESYIEGLKKAGIDIDSIPSIYGMNRILKDIGWAAVAVDGFIPPNAFMEFQAHKVLVIASDIRQLEHIEYTPAPDIIHEASGHAPIIASPDYAEFLRRLGEIGSKAILSKYDIDLYEAVRKLSILKEAPGVKESEVLAAEREVDLLQGQQHEFSEMAQIRNMQWWSVEYGLVGSMENPKIYGAGLLSSIGESEWCMSYDVEKIPYSIDVAHMGFDITKPQPQLYVTPDFAYLMEVLEEFANTLSIRKGGYKGLQKLIDSKTVGTIELSTGLQISGVFTKLILNDDQKVIYFKTEGPTALAYRDKELVGHGIETHKHGYSSPLGMLKSVNLPIENMTPVDLKAYNLYDGQRLSFEFESGIKVEGLNITGIRNVKGKNMVIQLEDCTVTYGEEILFKPEYGVFDMAIGNEITSAFAGAADSNSFPDLYCVSETKTIKVEKTKKEIALENLYQNVRDFRVSGQFSNPDLEIIFIPLKEKHPNDWLLNIELLELVNDASFALKIKTHLDDLGQRRPEIRPLIKSGLELIEKTADYL